MSTYSADQDIRKKMLCEGMKIPTFLYGTAWKEDKTRDSVLQAIEAGFRGIDTANQRRHYCEAAVGEAVLDAIKSGLVKRDELFLQTKYTYLHGQDHRLPYDPKAPPEEQARQSLESSLNHLDTDYLDSFILHGPSQREGLSQTDLEVWQALTDLRATGKTRFIGIANVSLDQLRELCEKSAKPPSFVQNRCFACTGWDSEVRKFCRSKGIHYQGFSLLTANVQELNDPSFTALVRRVGRSIPQIIFRFALQMGMIPLTGTTNPLHMAHDLEAYDFPLSEEDPRMIEHLGESPNV